MRTREEIERDIGYAQNRISEMDACERNYRENAREWRKRENELQVELAELDDPKPVPDMNGNESCIVECLSGVYYVESADCFGPVRPTKREAIEAWNKMMIYLDKPRIVNEDGKRFAVFPVKAEIPDDVKVVAVAVDMCGYPYIYRSDPHFKSTEWVAGTIPRGRVSIKNAKDMIVRVPK
jgi:hypothetical protein